ncbi:MAG: hypothetical protein KHZ62_00300 [Clostridiales bacterium]|nr:hypothetical protein [Clostridiales bacterium]
MYNRRYFRQYVMLKGSTQFFSQGSKLAGNAVIEIKNGKGRISVEAQGLRMPSKLRVFFMFPDGEVELGALTENGQGRGILKQEFWPDKIGEGWKIEGLEGIAAYDRESLVFSGSVKEHFHPRKLHQAEVLTVESEEPPSPALEEIKMEKPKEEVVEKMEDQKEETAPKEPIKEQKEETTPKEPIEEQKEETAPKEEDRNKILEEALLTAASSGNMHDTFRRIASQFRKEMDMLQAAGILTPEEAARVMGEETKGQEEKPSSPPAAVCFQEEKRENKAQTSKGKKGHDPIEDIFADHEHLFPFPTAQGEWVSITPREIALLPVKSCRMISSSFVSAGFHKYRHLILGRQEGKLYLGVPDRFFVDQAINRVQAGYRKFLNCEEGETKDGCCGYWMMNL